MKKRGRNRRINKRVNIIATVIAMMAIIIAIVFCIYIYRLDMLPSKYLTLMLIIIGSVYLILSLFSFPKKIKKGFKIFAMIMFIIFSLVFVYGIKYVDKAYDFINSISGELKQKEEYYISVSSDSKIVDIDELSGKKIGVYVGPSAINVIKAREKLEKKLVAEIIEFTDLEKMFENLQDGKVDALFLNDSQKTVLNGDLSYLGLTLKDIDSVYVYIDKKEDVVKIVDVINTPFNIYVAGGDAYGSINNVTNTDVNMIITVDPVNRKLLLTSIPRDYYVNLTSFGENAYDKLTHAGYYGIEESIKAVEKLLDTDINYYVKINFSTIEKVVDAIGGIDISNPSAFTSSDRETHFNSGNIHLNGHQALMYARERKSFADGDVQRVKNQQKVLEAIIKKVSSSTTLVANFTKVLDSVRSSMSTNMDSKSINKFVKMQLNDMRGWSMDSQNLTGYDYSSTNTYTFPGLALYVMKQDEESINKCKDEIKKYLTK